MEYTKKNTLIQYLKKSSCYYKEADVPADKTAFKVYDKTCVPIAYYVPENVNELYKHLTRQYVLKTLSTNKSPGLDGFTDKFNKHTEKNS